MRLTGQRLLDRYVVGARIARGGMGIVFAGDDTRLQRPVCVKVFIPLDPSRPEYATVLEHFVQEAFTLSRLTHPNTLRIYDFGYLDAVDRTGPFFVTEFADGGTLTDLVEARGGLAPAATVRILEPIVGALAEAHDAGVVHRDIKPSNILFTRAGGGLMPKLCDFSIAKATGDIPHRAQDTDHHVPLYSLSWAAPEQLGGGQVGPAADVFALGLMTLFMLTGEVVYPGEDLMQAYAMRAEGEATRIDKIRALSPSASVSGVLQHACAESPADRFVSVESFLDALRDALEDDKHDLARSTSVRPLVSAEGDSVPEPDLDGFSRSSTPTRATAGPLRVVEPVSPSDGPPAEPSRSQRPWHELHSLDRPHLLLGGTRLTLIEAGDNVLTIPSASGHESARVRVTPLDMGGLRLHLKGLNCFVRAVGARSSSGVDVSESMTVQMLTIPQEISATVAIALGRRHGHHLICATHRAIFAVAATLATWVVVLEMLPGPDAILLYKREPAPR